MPTPKLNAEIIAAAIEGFESQKRRIDTQIGELRAMLSGGRTEGTATPEAPARKRKVSAAARRRMAEGQKKRWAAIKADIYRRRNQRPDRNPQNPSGRSVLLAGVPFPRLRSAVGRSSEPRLRRRSQPAAKKAATQKTVAKKTAKRASAKPAKKTAPRHWTGRHGGSCCSVGCALRFHGRRRQDSEDRKRRGYEAGLWET